MPRIREHCLADYLNRPDGAEDSLAAFVVKVGEGVREESARLKAAGQYLKCQTLQAMAICLAEGYAELLHQRIRSAWGIGDPEGTTRKDLFNCRYRGCRFSFGYPACPDLSGQRLLWKLLSPERIGCQLTDGDMMEPEASVSALVFHHPQAVYYS
ncbi:MAG: vitamin B12 dependent-methionine synthase activation domain-containing protein [Planctomycetota bacterium]